MEASWQVATNEVQGGIRFIRHCADLVVPVAVAWQPHTQVFGLGDVLQDHTVLNYSSTPIMRRYYQVLLVAWAIEVGGDDDQHCN